MRHLYLVVALAICFATTSPAKAGIFFSLVDFGQVQTDLLSDESATVVRDVGDTATTDPDNGLLDVGDVLQGVFQIREVNTVSVGSVGGPNGSTIMGVFALEVAEVTSLGGNTLLKLGKVRSADNPDYTLDKLLSEAAVDTSGLTSTGKVTNGDSFALLSRTDDALSILKGGSKSLGLDGTMLDLGIVGTDWTVELLGGLDHALGGDMDDFYQILIDNSKIIDDGGSPLPAGDPPPASLPVVAEPFVFANYRTAFTITEHDGPSFTQFLELPRSQFDGTAASGDVRSGTNGGISSPSTRTPTGFTFADDGEFELQIIPEPTSLLVWGCLMGIVGSVVSRRRQRA